MAQSARTRTIFWPGSTIVRLIFRRKVTKVTVVLWILTTLQLSSKWTRYNTGRRQSTADGRGRKRPVILSRQLRPCASPVDPLLLTLSRVVLAARSFHSGSKAGLIAHDVFLDPHFTH